MVDNISLIKEANQFIAAQDKRRNESGTFTVKYFL